MTALRTRDCAASALTLPEFERTGTGDEAVLVGGCCVDCGAILFPVRQRCTSCFGQRIEKALISGEGRVVSFTIVRQAPSGYFGPVPYVVGNIALRDGVSALCPLAGKDVAAWRTGDAVSAFALDVKVSDTANRDVLAFRPSTGSERK